MIRLSIGSLMHILYSRWFVLKNRCMSLSVHFVIFLKIIYKK